ncbi:MAG: flagellar hook-associated protein FlgK [Deltaproteobacteria bacterium]|nr:flagellar hook-associated protein FlgK [Deltaproteobacteria bacterium]
MANMYSILNIAQNALFTQQTALQVTGHNIANVNTPGFSRQRATLQTTIPDTSSVGPIGSGVQAYNVERVMDQFIDKQIYQQTSQHSLFDSKSTSFTQLDTIFNEQSGQGLNKAMTDFWNSWQDLTNNPGGTSERTVVQAKSAAMANAFQTTYQGLEQQRIDAENRIKQTASDVNSIGKQLADLNTKIVQTESGGHDANDLRDQQTDLLNQLAQKIDFTAFEDKDKQLTVLVSGDAPLVSKSTTWQLTTQSDPANNNFSKLIITDNSATQFDITKEVTGGALKGYLDARDVDVPQAMDTLNKTAASIIDEVNRLHVDGYGLDGSTNNNFFNPVTPVAGPEQKNQGGAIIAKTAVQDVRKVTNDDYQIQFVTSNKFDIYDTTTSQYRYDIGAKNDGLVFNEGSAAIKITLDHGTYNGQDLAKDIQTQLNNNSPNKQTYQVSYDAATRHFSFSSDSQNQQSLVMGMGNDASTAGNILGFENSSDVTVAPGSSADSPKIAGHYDYSSGDPITFDGISVVVQNGTNTPLGGDVFDVSGTKDAAKYMALDSKIAADTDKIAAAAPDPSQLPPDLTTLQGDGNNAGSISQIQNKYLMAQGTQTISAFYNGLVSKVGAMVQDNTNQATQTSFVLTQLQTQRESVSGVNLDEEMTNLMKFQQAYNASAKMITTVGSMLDTLMKM